MKYVIILKSKELDNVLVEYKVYSTVRKAYNALKQLPEAQLTWWKLDKKHHKLVNKDQGILYYIQELVDNE